MGTYLFTGIVQNITINKKEMTTYNVTIDQILLELKEEVNLDCYNYSEDEANFYWRINPRVLEDNFVEFLETQFQMYADKKDKYMQAVIDKVGETKSGDDLIELAAQKTLGKFQLIDGLTEYISIMRSDGFKKDISVNYDLISFFMDGKIIMECYSNILSYFEKNIRLQRGKYPIVDCIKIIMGS